MKTTLPLGEVEIKLIGAGNVEFCRLVHFGGGLVEVDYEHEPGEPQILRADPDDCCEGVRESLTITGISPVHPLHFFAERQQYTVEAGEDIFYLLKSDDIERMEDEVLESLKTVEIE
jgi:hypothetical protein